jgi:hypothetical protein
MENTNCGEDCCFVKSGFCKTDRECPFYCESIWQVRGGTEIKTVKDCHPKRATMENNNLHYKMGCLQEIQVDLRNRLDRIELVLNALTEQSQFLLREKREKMEITKRGLKQENILNLPDIKNLNRIE